LREGRQRERRLIARELFWWLTGGKYELRKVLEKEGKRWLRVINLKVVYGSLMNACSEKEGKDVGQKRELGSMKVKPLLGCTEKMEKNSFK
jgi:hypothetical protein